MSSTLNPGWLSAERFDVYLSAASGDEHLASELYEWNGRASAALFELIGHFEVMLRNAIIHEMDKAGPDSMMPPGTPWTQGHKQIDEVVARLKQRNQPATAGRVYAGLSFGFWRNLFGTEFEPLWRHSLQYVFKRSRADRSVIAEYLESVNQLRNRVAHHGSLLGYDVAVEAQKLFRLAGWLDPAAEKWLRTLDHVTPLSATRPVRSPRDTIVVTGPKAWELYSDLNQPAFVFPAGRSVRVTERLAFYEDRAVQRKVPKITAWFDAVDWNLGNARRLRAMNDDQSKVLGGIIAATLKHGWNASVYQVFLLSNRSSPDTETLAADIAHTRTGRGTAFVKSHRYLSYSSLVSARDTMDLT